MRFGLERRQFLRTRRCLEFAGCRYRRNGMGLLAYNSIENRDYNVVLGIILLSSLLAMIGRLFSDLLYVAVDPRIRLR